MCHNLNISLLLAADKVRNYKEDNYMFKKKELSPKEKSFDCVNPLFCAI